VPLEWQAVPLACQAVPLAWRAVSSSDVLVLGRLSSYLFESSWRSVLIAIYNNITITPSAQMANNVSENKRLSLPTQSIYSFARPVH
jgi:hypothetical protein